MEISELVLNIAVDNAKLKLGLLPRSLVMASLHPPRMSLFRAS